MFTLLIGAHAEKNPARVVEYRTALEANMANPSIVEVVVFAEHPETWATGIANPKLRTLTDYRKRLLFSDAFAYANSLGEGKLVAVANADIELDGPSLQKVAQANLANTLFCVSRHDLHKGRWFVMSYVDCPVGADSWFFRTPLPKFPCDWPLGKDHCDWRLTYEASAAGMNVLNPALSIVTRHLHASRVRNRDLSDCVPGPHKYLTPTML